MEFASRVDGGGEEREKRDPRRGGLQRGGRVSLIERELSLISYRRAEKRLASVLAAAEFFTAFTNRLDIFCINTRTNIDPPPLPYAKTICLIYRMLIRIVRVDNFAEK